MAETEKYVPPTQQEKEALKTKAQESMKKSGLDENDLKDIREGKLTDPEKLLKANKAWAEAHKSSPLAKKVLDFALKNNAESAITKIKELQKSLWVSEDGVVWLQTSQKYNQVLEKADDDESKKQAANIMKDFDSVVAVDQREIEKKANALSINGGAEGDDGNLTSSGLDMVYQKVSAGEAEKRKEKMLSDSTSTEYKENMKQIIKDGKGDLPEGVTIENGVAKLKTEQIDARWDEAGWVWKGKKTYENWVYIGELVNGIENGEGYYTDTEKNRELHGTFRDWDIVTGRIVDNKNNKIYESKKMEKGEIVQGTMTDMNNWNIYTGDFVKWEPYWQGDLKLANGKIMSWFYNGTSMEYSTTKTEFGTVKGEDNGIKNEDQVITLLNEHPEARWYTFEGKFYTREMKDGSLYIVREENGKKERTSYDGDDDWAPVSA